MSAVRVPHDPGAARRGAVVAASPGAAPRGGVVAASPGARGAALGLALALLAAALAPAPARAQVVRAFTPRFSINASGDLAMIGNTLMSCSGGNQCNRGRNGSGNNVDNNDFSMQYVDVDGVGGTFCSSTADLALPPGATVLWAGLYWQGDSNSGARATARFATPAAAYATLTADRLDAYGSAYACFEDVTARVQAAGSGTYTVADVQSTTGTNRFAGWALVVVYRDPAAAPRNLVVFDGYAHVAPGATVSFGVSGFVTPPAGAVNTRLGVVAGEGDLGLTGDSFRLDGTALSDAVNPATNFFNSTVSRFGTDLTAKNPDYNNQLGWDVDLVAANGVLANGATGATISLSSSGDRYYPGVVAFATELYQPIIGGGGTFTKAATDLNGAPLRPGDAIEYAIALTNTGNDAATGVTLRDTIPANATYVPGSIVIASGPGAGPKTDAAGDDEAEWDAAGRRVIVRLGAGAGAIAGGTLAPGASTGVRFRVAVAPGTPGGAVVSNQAAAAFTGAQLGTAFLARSDGDAALPGDQPTDLVVSATAAVSGHAYADADHDAVRDAGEGGTGVALWVKLVPAAAPGSAVRVAPVDPGTGAWSLVPPAPGAYVVVLDDNALAADVTPTRPAGWLATETPSGAAAITMAAADLAGPAFGLFHGSTVSGRVFRDDGAGGGLANDGAPQGGEAGLAGVRVAALSAACAGGACDSALTGGGGNWTLWIPHGAGTVALRETNRAGWLSTGGAPGTTGGSYDRAADAVTFAPASGLVYAGVAFGDVPPATWVAAGAATVVAGAAATYAHVFTAGSAGAVSFSAAGAPSPALPGWSATLYRDLDCDGVLDPGEPPLAGPVALLAGEGLCVLARHATPAGAPAGAQEALAVTASFDHGGAAPPLLAQATLVDLTTVGATAGLVLAKSVDRATALPGDVLTYTVTYFNPGPGPVTAIEIHDATPAFTTFVDATCAALGAGLGGCALAAGPAPGATGVVRWTLSGALDPGATGSVRFRVRIEGP